MNKKNIKLFFFFTLFLLLNIALAQDSTKVKKVLENSQIQNNHKGNFIDTDGDGYNDNAPDHDGDGIPNGLDADFMKLKKRDNDNSIEYVDSDGDGINDNLQFNGKGRNRKNWKNKMNNKIGPQNTTGKNRIENNKNEKGKRKGKLWEI